MRLVLTLVTCALLGGCDHLYGGFDGGRPVSHERASKLAPKAVDVTVGKRSGVVATSPVVE